MEKAPFEMGGASAQYPSSNLIKIDQTMRRLVLIVFALLFFICLASIGIIVLAVIVVKQQDDIDNLEAADNLRLSRTAADARNSDRAVQSLFEGSGYWVDKEPMPFARSDHHVVAVNDRIYILGGLNKSYAVTDNVLIYDTVLDSYSQGPSLPTPLHRFGAGYDAENRKIYVFGGIKELEGAQSDSAYVLDVDKEEWTELPNMNQQRSDLCGTYVNGMVYAIGGYSLNYQSTLSSVEAFDVSKNEWKSVRQMLTPRGDCKAVTVNSNILVIGGYYDQKHKWNADAFRSEAEIYEPRTQYWKQVTELLYPRGDKAIVALPNNRVLVMGGETHNRGSHTHVPTHHVQEYSVSENLWIEKSPIPEGVFRSSAAYVNGMVFLFGGHSVCEYPKDSSQAITCIGSKKLQVYFDFDHPNLFVT